MKRWACGLAIGALVAIGSPAAARPHSHGERVHHLASYRQLAAQLPDPVLYLRAVALRWWGVPACGGAYTVSDQPDPGHPTSADGWASWSGPDGADVETGDAALFDDCTLSVPELRSAGPPAYFDWPEACAMFLHEYGHLTGHSHTADRFDVMYPLVEPDSTPAVCMTDPSGRRETYARALVPSRVAWHAHHS